MMRQQMRELNETLKNNLSVILGIELDNDFRIIKGNVNINFMLLFSLSDSLCSSIMQDINEHSKQAR